MAQSQDKRHVSNVKKSRISIDRIGNKRRKSTLHHGQSRRENPMAQLFHFFFLFAHLFFSVLEKDFKTAEFNGTHNNTVLKSFENHFNFEQPM
jgi:hypothetical protein